MKVSAIPAQITTVEDRIAGNLNLTQIILLSVPLFLTAIIFLLLPPSGKLTAYKLTSGLLISLFSSSLAIRIKNKLLIDILKLRLSFSIRSHIYVYRKQLSPIDIPIVDQLSKQLISNQNLSPAIKLSKRSRIHTTRLLKNDDYRVVFSVKDGGLIVKVSYI